MELKFSWFFLCVSKALAVPISIGQKIHEAHVFVKRLSEGPSYDLVHFLQNIPQESEFHCQESFSSSATSSSTVKN